MSDQIRISDSGELEAVPTTWDGEPMFSPASVAEGLFSTEAFEQVPGQTAWTLAVCPCCRQDFCADASDVYCPRCMEPAR